MIDELVEDALRELADAGAQASLWRASNGPEVSSLVECRCRLWDDSGLADAMDRGIVYNASIDDELRRLHASLKRVNADVPVDDQLSDPNLADARQRADSILKQLRRFGYERAGS